MSRDRLDQTHDPERRSFVEVDSGSPFPIQNLPFGVFRPRGGGAARVGVAIGDQVLDLSVLEEAGLLGAEAGAGQGLFDRPRLNEMMGAGRSVWSGVRRRVSQLLSRAETALKDAGTLRERALSPASSVEMQLPAEIGDYTDFYSSKHHAFNVGTMFRGPENALMPNWVWLPVAYHGRASSIVPSGTPVRRPHGQTVAPDADSPTFGPSRLVDYELEMGFFVGPGNELGKPIAIERAADHIFGMVLVNDWSARDIQKWEYQPLGPFLAKNFATTISCWVVTMDALEPFRCAGPPQDPAPLPYLASSGDDAYDIELDVLLGAPGLDAPHRLSRGNFSDMYWSVSQQLAHHTASGCNMRPGDLLASGTISGPAKDSRGCLLELTWRGTEPVALPDGSERKFLADGDEVSIVGTCRRDGVSLGFGECRGSLLPAAG